MEKREYMLSLISNDVLSREGKPFMGIEEDGCREFDVKNNRKPRGNRGMRAKSFLLRVKKKIMRKWITVFSCFKPSQCSEHRDEIKESRRPNESFASPLPRPEQTAHQESLVKEVAVEGQPPDTLIATAVSSLPTGANHDEQITKRSYHESNPLTPVSPFPLLRPESDDTPTASSSYSFFKDDLPRRMKSSPPMEKPTISVEKGTVASLRKTLSEHHTLKSYTSETLDEECTGREGAKLCEVKDTTELEKSSGYLQEEEDYTQDETVRKQSSSIRDVASRMHTELRDLSQESLLQNPIGDSSSESSLRDFITPSSSTQDSSIMLDQGITEKSLAVSNDSNSTLRSKSLDDDGGFHLENTNVNEGSGNGAMDTGLKNMGMVAAGIEEIREGVKAGTTWLYQTLCSLLSNEDEEDGLDNSLKLEIRKASAVASSV